MTGRTLYDSHLFRLCSCPSSSSNFSFLLIVPLVFIPILLFALLLLVNCSACAHAHPLVNTAPFWLRNFSGYTCVFRLFWTQFSPSWLLVSSIVPCYILAVAVSYYSGEYVHCVCGNNRMKNEVLSNGSSRSALGRSVLQYSTKL